MINKVTLVGNIGQQPELKTTKTGTQFLVFSVATNENYRDSKGEWQKDTQWHTVRVFTNPTYAHDKLNKGDKVYIEGKLKSYEIEGRKLWEIKCQMWRNLSTKQDNEFTPSDKLLPPEPNNTFDVFSPTTFNQWK